MHQCVDMWVVNIGLDPSSRRLLWDVIRSAKQTAAVVLTTHSMEEAEALCDRIGIFVGGRLSCIGNPQVSTASVYVWLYVGSMAACEQRQHTVDKCFVIYMRL